MKLMFHLRSVKKSVGAKFPSDTFGKVEDEVGRGNAFQRLPTDALELDQRAATDQFCYHLFTRFQGDWVTAGESAASNLVSVTPGGDQ